MIDVQVALWLIGILTLALVFMSGRMRRLQNRIRRLEQETGIDYAPPDVLNRPPEQDNFRDKLLLCHRVDVAERRIEHVAEEDRKRVQLVASLTSLPSGKRKT